MIKPYVYIQIFNENVQYKLYYCILKILILYIQDL